MAGIEEINAKIIDSVTGFGGGGGGLINAIGLLVLAAVVLGAVGWWAIWYSEKKKYKKAITAFEIIGQYYQPTIRDHAKVVKIGKGGFEILYLRKLKTWKIAYGGRIGQNTYYFFIDNIGYWHNGMLSANLLYIDNNKGLVPVVVTSPTMRAQYTALEKQIEDLDGNKKNFWDKYGSWVLSIGFILIVGVFAWLSFKEVGQFLGAGSNLAKQMTELAEVMERLTANLANSQGGGSGLVQP